MKWKAEEDFPDDEESVNSYVYNWKRGNQNISAQKFVQPKLS